MHPVLKTAVAKARAGDPLSLADEATLLKGIADATLADPVQVAASHAKTLQLMKDQRLTIVVDGAGNLTIRQLMVVPVTRNGINFPATGYCLVSPVGDPIALLCGHTADEAWAAGERQYRRRRADLQSVGWRVVLADFPEPA